MNIREIIDKLKKGFKDFFGYNPEQEVEIEDAEKSLKETLMKQVKDGEISKPEAVAILKEYQNSQNAGERLTEKTNASVTITPGDKEEGVEKVKTPQVKASEGRQRNDDEGREI